MYKNILIILVLVAMDKFLVKRSKRLTARKAQSDPISQTDDQQNADNNFGSKQVKQKRISYKK
jgi:hypothetical protein